MRLLVAGGAGFLGSHLADPLHDAPDHRELRLGEPQRIALDSSAFTAATGWVPRIDLETGLPGTVDWISQTLHRAPGTDSRARH